MNIFEKAAEVLMKDGHCKYTTLEEDGSRCAIGALMKANDWQAGYMEAAARAADKLKERGFVPGRDGMDPTLHPLAQWNDAPATTGEDVILLFKELGSEA